MTRARTPRPMLRASAAEARALLLGLARVRAELDPAGRFLDPLAERVARFLPADERARALADYRERR